MNFNRSILTFGLLAAVVLSSCREDGDLPDMPVINSVEYSEGTKELAINFTDGDGNFGLSGDMNDPPFQDSLDNGEYNEFSTNLWLDVWVRSNGVYELLLSPKFEGFDFRIPELTPQGQNKQLRVTATYDLDFDLNAFAEGPDLDFGDTLKFDVILVDRDLNLSQMVESEGHILRE